MISNTGELYVDCMYEVGRGDCDRPKILYSKSPGYEATEFVKSTFYTKRIAGNINLRYSENGNYLCNIEEARKKGLLKAKCGKSGWIDLS